MVLDSKKDFCRHQSLTNKYKKRLIILLVGFVMVEITRLFWKKAFTSDNFLLGDVESAELNTDKVVVCLPASTVKTFTDTAILNKTKAELRELKECKE
jgi:hypothetical protein